MRRYFPYVLVLVVGLGGAVLKNRSVSHADVAVAPPPDIFPTLRPDPGSVHSPACRAVDDGRPAADRRRVSPGVALPYSAPIAGEVPADGQPVVGGVRLPSGSRCPHYWASDGPVPDAYEFAHTLAREFTHTGLWPVLWDPGYDPDEFANAMGLVPPEPRRGDAETVLRRRWAETTLEGGFPGLAAGTRAIRPFAFGAVYEKRRTEGYTGTPALLLVPANRPSDVIGRLRVTDTGWLSSEDIGTVVRSWEERFGAVPTMLGPSWMTLSVGAPPTTFEQARRIADEHVALSPETGDLDEYARTLLQTPESPNTLSLATWEFGWSD